MVIEGTDYAWGRPGVAALKAAGKHFVCRYLSHDTSGKNLDHAEAKALSDAGLWIVVVWESTANRALAGHDAGAQDARAAEAQALACGMPPGRPIYFAVDFDAAGQTGAVNQYLDGAASVLGVARVGLYGGYAAVHAALNGGHARWGWGTYAWSGGQWDPRGHIEQYSNDHPINGVGCDYDRAVKADYGQWRIGVVPGGSTPTPTPVPPITLEDDMPYGQLTEGPKATTPMSWPSGKMHAIGFFADTAAAGPGKDGKAQVAHLTVSYHVGGGKFVAKAVVVDGTKGKTVVVFGADTAHVDAVSVRRDDDGAIPVAWDAS